jgi:hypothetical protein
MDAVMRRTPDVLVVGKCLQNWREERESKTVIARRRRKQVMTKEAGAVLVMTQETLFLGVD